jgi:hypothetical protein
MSAAPLQVILVRRPTDEDTAPFEDAIVRAFQGGKDPGGYVATGEDLGIQLRVFSDVPAVPAQQMVDEFLHTLVIVLVDHDLMSAGDALWDWLDACWRAVDQSNDRHRALAFPMDERLGGRFTSKRPSLSLFQVRSIESYGERAVRPAMIALLTLHSCRELLARAVPAGAGHPPGAPPGFLRLFISHAKMDGLPLAQGLKYQIESIGWLKSFYDAADLPAGCNWQMELENGVGSSLIVMLRTESYDGRFWCQKEVRWADEYATPAVLVDARTGLQHPSASLPFDRVPTVRIPDGNLLRVLFAALREGLRFLHFVRMIEEMKHTSELPPAVELRVFSFTPSMPALLRACRSLMAKAAPGAPKYIVHPDPPLGTGLLEAAQALVAAHAPGAVLTTPNTLAATRATP